MITSQPADQTALEERLLLRFLNPDLLRRALTHKSYYNENPELSPGHNEVLEFLGDAVLDLCLGHLLMTRFPLDDEGRLSKKRASLVNENALSQIGLELGLEDLVQVGRGERASGGNRKPRLLASALEALLGAVFLDQGFESAARTIEKLFRGRIAGQDWSEDFVQDYKTRLQERVQSKRGATPSYDLLAQTGPDHEKRFKVEVRIGQSSLGVGTGQSKKQAEQDAARQALEQLSKSGDLL